MRVKEIENVQEEEKLENVHSIACSTNPLLLASPKREVGDGLALRVSGTVHWGHDCCMESLYPPCYCLPLSPLQTYGRSSPCQFSCLMHTAAAAAALVQHPILMQASLNSHYPPLFQEADIKLLLIKTKLHSRC